MLLILFSIRTRRVVSLQIPWPSQFTQTWPKRCRVRRHFDEGSCRYPRTLYHWNSRQETVGLCCWRYLASHWSGPKTPEWTVDPGRWPPWVGAVNKYALRVPPRLIDSLKGTPVDVTVPEFPKEPMMRHDIEHQSINPFYPRPVWVLAFGYCHCLRLCVCVCLSVCQSRVCPRDNSSPVQARITKFGVQMQKTLVKVPIVFLWGGGDQPWPPRSNLTWKSNFTSCWACPYHNWSPVQTRITKFGPKMHLNTVKIPIDLTVDRHWPLTVKFNLKVHFFPILTLSAR